MKAKLLLCALMLLLFSGHLLAQTMQITGKVTNANNDEPMSAVSILADKKVSSVSVKPDGTYTVKVDSKAKTLIFSYIGYVTQTVDINGRTQIDVRLLPSQAALDDVVVIGYGTQRKSHVTGSISKYQNERLDEVPVTRLDQALQGKIAGVTVQNLNPESGAAPRIRVRGLSSINAGVDPLVVVDGHPVPDGLAFVNMADVQSVEVLKDAASLAIYGSRGASGVILITTRSGKADKTKYTVKISSGVRSPYKTQDMMTVTDYVNLLFAEAEQRKQDPSVLANRQNLITNTERAQYVLENQIIGEIHDWQKEGIRDANITNVQMNVSGGKKEAKYFISGAYNKEEGIMYHSNYDKFSLRGKFETQLSNKVKLNLNLNPTYSKRERPANNYIDFVRFPSFMPARHTDKSAAFVNQVAAWANIRPGDWAQAGHFNGRVYTGLMPDGSTWTTSSASDPFSSSNNNPKSVMETRNITSNDYRLLSSADLTINILKGLDFKTLASSYVTYTEGLDFAQTGNNRAGDVNRGIYTNRLYIDLLTENTLNYTTRIKDHSIAGFVGFTAQKTKTKNGRTEATNFPSESINTVNTAGVIVAPYIDPTDNVLKGTYTLESNVGLISYLGRFTYSFKDKYLFYASLRADGSSKFGPGHKWGYFPAVSGGWVVSKEKFMDEVKWVNNLKLRASWGLSGNNNINSDFAFVDQLYGANYVFGTGGSLLTGQVPDVQLLANPLISWERTYQTNFGVDLTVLRNRISVSAELYESKSQALLLRENVMAITGAQFTFNNIGKVRNRGVEVELNTKNISKKNFTWNTTANFSANKNKLLEFGNYTQYLSTGEGSEVYISQVGQNSINFFGYKTDGVWLSQADADAVKAKEVAVYGTAGGTNIANYYTAGGLRFVDVNGDGRITPDDRTVIGNPFPDFTWGLNNQLTYKNFDLSFLFQGVQGVDVINGDARYNESRRYNRKYVENRWVSPMFPGDGQTPYFTNGATQWTISDYTVEDGSYFALRELIVGYKLPSKVSSTLKLSGLRVYASVQNAYVHWAKNYRGINPEARMTSGTIYGSPLVDGYQRGSYPMPRTILFGLDINF